MKRLVLAVAYAAACGIAQAAPACVGDWALDLPFPDNKAGWLRVAEGETGATASLMWRWTGPNDLVGKKYKGEVAIDGANLSIRYLSTHWISKSADQRWISLKGCADGDRIALVYTETDGTGAVTDGPRPVSGRRLPPPGPKPDLSRVRFGDKIELWDPGLWENRNPDWHWGWTFDPTNRIISNRILRDADGKPKAKGANIVSKRRDFLDCQLTFGVRMPKGCNSGVYLRGNYEIQMMDSYGQKPDSHNMGALYGRLTPRVAAEKPAGEWQQMRVCLYRRHLTVVLNGETIIDNEPVEGVTGGALSSDDFAAGPLGLQGDHSDVDFRDLVLQPILPDAPVVALPGEPVERPALAPTTFPDILSAVVWRNWFSVPADRIAAATGVAEADIRTVAAEMGLPPDPAVPSEWTKKGYITTLRANWHLLGYEELMKLVGKDRTELRTCLLEEDFLFTKLGRLKPKCGPVAADLAAGRAARQAIAKALKAEGIDDFSEEPRFAFMRELSTVPADAKPASADGGLRLIFSYFADYVDPLGDDAVGSYPDGLLARLANQGVNAVWLHVVLSMLSQDPAFPEFGEGAERRLANLRKLVARAKRHGIRVFLYLNEPRPQPEAFFAVKGREGMKGVPGRNGVWSMCTKAPETRRWLAESVERVFREAPGLGGIFTITASENLTNCASHWEKNRCPRCKAFTNGEIIGDVNRLMIEAMHRAAPEAESVVYNWGWPPDTAKDALTIIPTNRVSMLAVSERGVPIMRGGVANKVNEYSVSSPGPSPEARTFWTAARAAGFRTAAKVQSGVTWELSPFPYLPVAELVAEHARNLAAEKVDGFMLSWSLGSYPAPNLKLFSDPDLQRFSRENYGTTEGMDAVWKAFADGFREYPFDISCAYFGPQHMGPANPLYAKPTGWEATMVGMPYDDFKKWRSLYPKDVWIAQMDKAAKGFARGCELFAAAIGRMPEAKRAEARREFGLFRAATLHLASAADQGRFVQARNRGDAAAMRTIAARELPRAKELLKLVRADSRIGYECSNSYFYTPQDLREKVLCCLNLK